MLIARVENHIRTELLGQTWDSNSGKAEQEEQDYDSGILYSMKLCNWCYIEQYIYTFGEHYYYVYSGDDEKNKHFLDLFFFNITNAQKGLLWLSYIWTWLIRKKNYGSKMMANKIRSWS